MIQTNLKLRSIILIQLHVDSPFSHCLSRRRKYWIQRILKQHKSEPGLLWIRYCHDGMQTLFQHSFAAISSLILVGVGKDFGFEKLGCPAKIKFGISDKNEPRLSVKTLL